MTRVRKIQKNLASCYCPKCPKYDDCTRGRDEKLFCAKEVGRSSCDLSIALGCLCVNCPVHERHDLQAGYYCMHGPADYVDV